MTQDCDICGGCRFIRLPIRQKVSAAVVSAYEAMAPGSREYPCPECANTVPLERVAVLEAHTFVDSRYDGDPGFRDHMRKHSAHELVEHVLRGGFIDIRRGPTDKHQLRYPMVATLGVVSKKQVATLEARIAERQGEVAREVVAEAKRLIDNWGSHYGHTDIRKDVARREINDALQNVLQARNSRLTSALPDIAAK